MHETGCTEAQCYDMGRQQEPRDCTPGDSMQGDGIREDSMYGDWTPKDQLPAAWVQTDWMQGDGMRAERMLGDWMQGYGMEANWMHKACMQGGERESTACNYCYYGHYRHHCTCCYENGSKCMPREWMRLHATTLDSTTCCETGRHYICSLLEAHIVRETKRVPCLDYHQPISV